MTETKDKIFVDTNILVYAYDKDSGKKYEKAKKIITDCFNKKIELYISNQILAEFVSVTSKKIKNPLPEKEIKEIINEINKFNGWKKINYSNDTIQKIFDEKGKNIWGRLIAATMKENFIFKIYTENTKDFLEHDLITAVNPL